MQFQNSNDSMNGRHIGRESAIYIDILNIIWKVYVVLGSVYQDGDIYKWIPFISSQLSGSLHVSTILDLVM